MSRTQEFKLFFVNQVSEVYKETIVQQLKQQFIVHLLKIEPFYISGQFFCLIHVLKFNMRKLSIWMRLLLIALKDDTI